MNRILQSSYFVLFAILYVLLSWNSRFAADDFYFLHLSRDSGVWQGMAEQYTAFSGRWACHLWSLLLLKLSDFRLFLPLLFTGTMVAFYFALSALFYKVFVRTNVEESNFNSDAAVFLLISSIFFCTPSTGEVWFWFISVSGYLWSFIAILAIINSLLGKKYKNSTKLFLVVFSLYIGGASESLAVSFLLGLILTAIYSVRKYGRQEFFKSEDGRKIIIVISTITASLLISFLAPGTNVRYNMLPHPGLLEKCIIFIKAFGKIFLQYYRYHLPFLILFSLSWLRFGNAIRKSQTLSSEEAMQLLRRATILYLTLLVIIILPVTLMLSESGPARTFFPVVVSTIAYFAFLFTLTGIFFFNQKILNTIAVVQSFLLLTYCSFQLIKQYNTTSVYASSFDDRITQIDLAKKENSSPPAELPMLPESGMLFNAEINSDTNYYVNKHWQAEFGIAVRLMDKRISD